MEKKENSTDEKLKTIMKMLYKLDVFNQEQKPHIAINNESISSLSSKLNVISSKLDSVSSSGSNSSNSSGSNNNSNNNNNATSDTSRQTANSYASVAKKGNVKPAVVIRPKNRQDSKKTFEDITKNVERDAVNVCGTRNVKDGGIVLRCVNATETMKVKQIVSEKLGDDYEVVLPKVKHPRLRITNIPVESQKELVIEELKKHNETIRGMDIKLVTVINKKATSRQTASNEIVIEINGADYSKFMELKVLKLPWRECRIFEHVYMKRCYKCLGFSHIANDCKNEQKCSKCAGPHKFSECKSKKVSCANCRHANESLKHKMSTNHHAWSKDCTIYKRRIESLVNKIEYNASE
ncbi:uncharacterized protein LOC129571155 [Sitodiplosis mosellana]|uniref:uncharacterized protein LOC129571155 n=1 Tax=Sitodiplosis mosellana TaxID=263140 RepID=UPI002443D8AA|nr:uncharacterized protein LOC129571155 [Sitodiplosis mosellana]